MNLAELTLEALKELATEKRAAFDALIAEETPSDEQIEQAEALATEIEEIDAEFSAREQKEAERAERLAALKNRFSTSAPEDTQGTGEEEDGEDDAEEEAPAEEPAPVDEPPKTQARSRVATLAKKTERPIVESKSRVSITASADVPGFATGSEMDMDKVSKALINRMKAFSAPTGDGRSENLLHFGVASFNLDFPEDLTATGVNDLEVFNHAASESRLEGNSLTAAGGWCAPSETIYDLCEGETLEGLVSVPEVNVTRGGIRFTRGPSFQDLYDNVGFSQTEAEAIAGTAKTCVEVDCPPFEEVRLDAVGLCIKAPILTNAAYPELVRRWISGSMVAHQHKVSADVIGRMVAAAGAPIAPDGLGSTAADTLGLLENLADHKRQQYRLGLSATLEVVVPFWVKGAIRSDLQTRTGQDSPVTDQQIRAHFAARNLNVQFVYNWQPLAGDGTYPATFDALLYPAGAFVKGTADVINLNAVYDAAELAQNIYTALFFEQGLLVAQTCFDADVVTVPVCNAGRTGAADLTCAAPV